MDQVQQYGVLKLRIEDAACGNSVLKAGVPNTCAQRRSEIPSAVALRPDSPGVVNDVAESAIYSHVITAKRFGYVSMRP